MQINYEWIYVSISISHKLHICMGLLKEEKQALETDRKPPRLFYISTLIE